MFKQILITRAAEKDLAKLNPTTRERIIIALHNMITNQSSADLKKLRGHDDIWRLRVGVWRVILKVSDQTLVAYAIRVKHRREAY